MALSYSQGAALAKAEIKRRAAKAAVEYLGAGGIAALLGFTLVLLLILSLLVFALFVPLALFVSDTPGVLDGGYSIGHGSLEGWTPEEIAFVEIDESALLSWLAARDSALATPDRVAAIVRAARLYDVDPRLLVAITGQEQGFVPRNQGQSERIAANPWNVFGGWYRYPSPNAWAANPSADAFIEKSAAWAAQTVARLSRNAPEGISLLQWINGCIVEGGAWRQINPRGVYATDAGWHIGVRLFYDQLQQAVKASPGWTSAGPWTWPVPGIYQISSPFGYRGGEWHTGIDVPAAMGTPIVAARPGRVTVAGRVPNTGYGLAVYVDHGNGVTTRYAHMSGTAVNKGQIVEAGQPIGYMGSSGRSTGLHLHFEICVNGSAQNPTPYFRK
ncbi:MAG: M23 family metallopeptidase [Desulforudis sp.]|nr:MAG: M23 family metallopeptidase [Desulforudis sp.]